MHKVGCTIVAVAVFAAASVVGVGDAAAAAEPTSIVGTANELHDDVEARVDATPAGDHLRISIFVYRNAEIHRALIDALGRGVAVTLRTEARQVTWLSGRYLDELRANGAAVTVCDSSCSGTFINHQKVIAADDWALVSSGNWGPGSTLFEGAMLIRRADAPRTHAAIVAAVTSNDDRYTAAYDGGYGMMVPGASGLDFYGRRVAKMSGPDCVIQLAFGHMKPGRITRAFISELRQAAKRGCKVDLVWSGTYRARLHDWIKAPATATETKFEAEHQSNVHAKFLAFSGTYNGRQGKTLVITGSTNMVGRSFTTNDEMSVQSRHASDFVAYSKFHGIIDGSQSGTHR